MDKARQWWQSLTDQQRRIALLTAGVVVVVSAFSFALTGRHGDWQPVYSRLTSDDLAAATELLAQQGIPYEADDATGTLRVPSDKTAAARMALAQSGLPHSGAFHVPGFELMDQTSFGSSDFVQHANYLRALQGELAHSISTLDPIASARVHLNLPEKSIFDDQSQAPSASVVVALKPGATLSAAQTRAIVFFVSRAIERLKPENIAVVDTDGTLLWAGGQDDGGGVAGDDYLQLQQQTERSLEQRLQSMLDGMIGPGKSTVRVNVELQTERRHSESETYLPVENPANPKAPAEGIPSSVTSSTEKYEAKGQSGAGATGAAGVGTTLQMTPGSGGKLVGGNYTKEESKTEYRVSRRVESIEQPPGSVKRLSVSVVINGAIHGIDQTALQEAINAAAGVQTSRGDTVSVIQAPAVKSEPTTSPTGKAHPAHRRLPWPLMAAALVALMVMAGVVVMLRRRGAPRLDYVVGDEPPAADGRHPTYAPEPALTAAAELTSREQLRRVAQTDPDRVAELLRGWIRQHAMAGGSNGGVN